MDKGWKHTSGTKTGVQHRGRPIKAQRKWAKAGSTYILAAQKQGSIIVEKAQISKSCSGSLGTINDTIRFSAAHNYEHYHELLNAIEA